VTCSVCQADDHLVCLPNRNSDEQVTVLIEIGNDLEARWGR